MEDYILILYSYLRNVVNNNCIDSKIQMCCYINDNLDKFKHQKLENLTYYQNDELRFILEFILDNYKYVNYRNRQDLYLIFRYNIDNLKQKIIKKFHEDQDFKFSISNDTIE